MRAREAKYKQLEVINSSEEQWAMEKPYDPYQEKDFRTPTDLKEFSPGGPNRLSYYSEMTAVNSAKSATFDDPFLSPKCAPKGRVHKHTMSESETSTLFKEGSSGGGH